MIHLFYHLFMANNFLWREILEIQLNELVAAGLYEQLASLKIGVVYSKKSQLEVLEDKFVEKFKKIELIYKREINSFPILIWNDPKIEIKTQLGETILKMIEFAKQNSSDNYLFMHSKGSTKPNPWCRSQMNHFEDRGIKKEKKYNRGVRDKTNDLILKDITTEIVTNWKEKVKILENNDFYYYIFNFFYATGAFLSKFDFKDYNENGCFPQEYTIKDRHWSAMFPVNLYGVINNLDLSIKSQKDDVLIETKMIDVGENFDSIIEEYTNG